MVSETDIILTLTAVLVAAALMGNLAAFLRMPPMLGFLLAGVAVGPFTPGLIANTSIASQLAEFGIILLMFGIGIHFSVRELRRVVRVALPASLLQVIIVTAITVALMQLWGWTLGAGLLLGLALSISSTVIAMTAFDRRGELGSMHVRLAVGWSLIEDLVALVVVILVPLLAGPGSSRSVGDLAPAVGIGLAKVAVLAVVMLVVGSRVVPPLLVMTSRFNSRELRLVTVLALALGIGYGAAWAFDVSYALGAFLAGLVVSEADLSHQAAADALPLQDAFAVLFFVSVGMLVDPEFVLEQPSLLIVVVILIMLAKPAATLLLLYLLRFPKRPGLLIAASRGQIGEFSFVVGTIGLAEGVLNDNRVNLILSSAIVSILLNPVLFGVAERIVRFMPDRIPVRFPVTPLSDDAFHQDGRLRDHVAILGGGRVGGLIVQEMLELEIPVIVADYQREVIENLRASGIPTIYGDVANPLLLDYLELENARALVVAITDETAARLAVEHARAVRPDLPIVVRTHTEHERELLDNVPYTEAVMGERELAVEMTSFVLRQYGLTLGELDAVEQDLRSRPGDEPLPGQIAPPK